MRSPFRNGLCAFWALIWLLAGPWGPAPAAADGTLILGASPDLDPFLNESENLTFSVLLAIPQEVTLAWYLDGLPQNSSDQSFDYRPAFGSAGVHNLSVEASTPTARDSHSWKVTVLHRDIPIELTGWEPVGDLNILAGGSQSFRLNISNPGGAPLVIQWSIGGGLVPGEDGPEFTFTAGFGLSGRVELSAFVSDGATERAVHWNLTVKQPLVVVPTGTVSLQEGEAQTFRVEGTEGREVAWALDGENLGSTGGNYTYRPGFGSAGIHNLTASISGGIGHTWTVIVANVNQPPFLPEGQLVEAVAGDTTTVRVDAYDPDGTLVGYEWDIDSDGHAELSSTSTPNLTYRFEQAGQYRATLKVTDNEGASASTVYLFDVKDRGARFNWWIPSALAGILVALVLAAAIVQRIRISRIREERSRSEFFRERRERDLEAEAASAEAGEGATAAGEPAAAMTPEEEPSLPPQVAGPEEEPELLKMKPFLSDKRAELEVSPDHHESDIPLSKRATPAPPRIPGPEPEAHKDAAALKDKGAESETGASETELHRPRPVKKTKKK